MSDSSTTLPLILAGPMLRQCLKQQVAFWLVTSQRCDLDLYVSSSDEASLTQVPSAEVTQQSLQVGTYCFIVWFYWTPQTPLPESTKISYDFRVKGNNADEWITQTISDLCYDGSIHPHFSIDMKIKEVFHGSCRKPHHQSDDGLAQMDRELSERINRGKNWPDFLMMCGDQIYTDDVAGPMLYAIHQVINKLGLVNENLSGACVNSAEQLYVHPNTYYQRTTLLPDNNANENVKNRFWQGKRKPIFTSVTINNHLVSFAEVISMYLLVWSPTLWDDIKLDDIPLSEEFSAKYDLEKSEIIKFRENLWRVRRVFAHIPTYMIFDDHDITDDWNLTRGWEEASYAHPFSKRIIGNALLAYLLCQGWGNNPQAFSSLEPTLSHCFDGGNVLDSNQMIDCLLKWNNWSYQLPTQPPTIILDTRTQRWQSESRANRPSGLMDWESLCDLQQQLIGNEQVIIVSPAPVFGVKLIESIQKIFTFFGKALTVDAENWMAHKGTASVILSIFRHKKTPQSFIILSGDVHYSFVYDIKLRFRRISPHICQITSSGIKNEFPRKLLGILDKLNRWLFHQYSPLNWLTRRRKMNIHPRKPVGEQGTLLNRSGIGILTLQNKNKEAGVSTLTSNGEKIDFL